MKIMLAVALLVLLGGCASIRPHEAADAEQDLAAAGFQLRLADTPERAQELAAMPPLKIVARTQDNDAR